MKYFKNEEEKIFNKECEEMNLKDSFCLIMW